MMEAKNVKRRMKVVPHSKTADGRSQGLINSAEWGRACRMDQPYLYVNYCTGDEAYPEFLLHHEDIQYIDGDYFIATDFEPYTPKE